MLSKLSVKKPFTVIVCIIIIIVLGVVSVMNIGVDLLPSMNLPYIVVATIYPGAPPEEVEKQITIPVENGLASVSNISTMQSTSNEHYSMVILEFANDTDVDVAYSDVNAALKLVSFPDDDLLQEPIVLKINPSMLPVMQFTMAREDASIKESNAYLNDVIQGVGAIDGVASANANGLINNLAYVNINNDRMAEAIIDYAEDTLGGELAIPLQIKERVREELLLVVDDDMTAEELLDEITRIIKDTEDWGGEASTDEDKLVAEIVSRVVDILIQQLGTEVNGEMVYTPEAKEVAQEIIDSKYMLSDENEDIFYDYCDQLFKEGLCLIVGNELGSMSGMLTTDILDQLIYAQDFDMPSGSVTVGSSSYVIKIGESITTRDQLLNMPVISYDIGTQLDEYVDNIMAILSLAGVLSNGQVSFSEADLQSLVSTLYEVYGNRNEEPETGINALTSAGITAWLSGELPQSVKDELPETWEDDYTVYIEENAPYKWNDALTANWQYDSVALFKDYLDDGYISLTYDAFNELETFREGLFISSIPDSLAYTYVGLVSLALPAEITYNLPSGWQNTLKDIFVEKVPVDWTVPAYAPTGTLVNELMIITADNVPADWTESDGFPSDYREKILAAGEATVVPTADELVRAGIEAAIEALPEEQRQFLEELFRDRSRDDIEDYVKGTLFILRYVSPNGIIIPEGDEDGNIPSDAYYTVDFNLIKSDLEAIDEKLIIPFTLKGIADVYFFDDSSSQITTLLTRDGSGNLVKGSAVNVSIDKEPDKSTAEVTKAIEEYLAARKKADSSFSYEILSNDGDYIDFMLSNVLESLLYGGLLAIAILFIFLRNVKATLTVGASIVISVIGTFVMMYFAGITLNVVSMGGLALGVGMLVDNSIVVIENIYRMRANGKSKYEASIQGAKQVGMAIISSTLTTVIVFLPIVFIEGLTKQIFKDLALTVAFSLLASLIVALTLVPMATSTFLTKPAKKETKFFYAIKRGYAKLLNFNLRHKIVPLLLVLVLFGGAIFGALTMEIELFPKVESSSVSLSTTVDTVALDRYNNNKSADEPYLTYDDVVTQMTEAMIAETNKIPEVKSVGITTSGGLTVAGFSLGGGSLSATLMLADEKERSRGSTELIEVLNKAFEPYYLNSKGVFKIEASSNDMFSLLTGSDQTISLYSNSLDQMKTEAETVRQLFVKKDKNGTPLTDDLGNYIYVDGIKSISLSNDSVTEEYRIKVDKNKANQYGLTVAQVFLQVQSALSESTAIHTLNLTENDGSQMEFDVYAYTGDYKVSSWYNGEDKNGNVVPVYFVDNGNDESKIKYSVKNDTGRSMYVKVFDGIVDGEETYSTKLVFDGGQIPVRKEGAVYSYVQVTAKENGAVETTRSFTVKDNMVYNSVDRTEPFDIVTFNISSQNLLDATAETVVVPLYKLLDEGCFTTDDAGNILYRSSTITGERIPLSLKTAKGYDSINRIDKIRTEQLTIVFDPEYKASEVEKIVESTLSQYNAPEGLTYADATGNKYVDEVFNDLYLILGFAIVLIYLVMVSLFQGLKSPVIIMITIPLAFTGAVIALMLAGISLNVMALIGMIVLMGIVVNNGIVFVDYCNQLIEAGVPKRIALLRTGTDRLRPILMTALTTILALVSMAFDFSESGAMLRPLAMSVIGGMIYSTVLTLLIVPVFYDILNRKKTQSERAKAMKDVDIDKVAESEVDESVLAQGTEVIEGIVSQKDLDKEAKLAKKFEQEKPKVRSRKTKRTDSSIGAFYDDELRYKKKSKK